jgi:hypothetical protein
MDNMIHNYLDNITFEKIIVPVIAAILTTLIVEYFAKPSLEARKARLLRDREQFDRIIFSFQRISASLASLPTKEQLKGSDTYHKYASIMLNESRDGLYELIREMSHLTSVYVANHREHVAKTMKFIGYLLAKVELSIDDGRSSNIPELKKIAKNLELFDIYYLVYVYMYDSQESHIRRILWRMTKKKSNNEKIDKLLIKYKLSD